MKKADSKVSASQHIDRYIEELNDSGPFKKEARD